MLSNSIFRIVFFILLSTLVFSSCKKDKETVPDVIISFDETPEGYSINEVVTFTNTSQHADADSYHWTIHRMGINTFGDIEPQLLLDSNDKDIQYTFSLGYYRVELTGSNSNSFGSEVRGFNF